MRRLTQGWFALNLYAVLMDYGHLWALYSSDRFFHYGLDPTPMSYFFMLGTLPLALVNPRAFGCWVILCWNLISFLTAYPAISGAYLVLRVLSLLFFVAQFGDTAERYAKTLIKCQITIIYALTLWHRVGDPYWFDGTFVTYWMQSNFARFQMDVPFWLSFFLTHLTTVSEIFIMIGLWFRQTRIYAWLVGVALFAGLLVFSTIPLFPIVMIFCHTVFLNTKDLSIVQNGASKILLRVRRALTNKEPKHGQN